MSLGHIQPSQLSISIHSKHGLFFFILFYFILFLYSRGEWTTNDSPTQLFYADRYPNSSRQTTPVLQEPMYGWPQNVTRYGKFIVYAFRPDACRIGVITVNSFVPHSPSPSSLFIRTCRLLLTYPSVDYCLTWMDFILIW